MVVLPSTLISLVLGVLAGRALSSRISFFSDGDCEDFKHDIQGPNGYPDGDCSVLESNGNYSSFKVVRLDRGCDVTIYGPNTTQGICSPGGSIVAVPGRCYSDPIWTYYSIDTCTRQQDSTSPAADPSTSAASTQSPSTPSPSTPSAPPQTSESASADTTTASSDSNTGAIAGGVVGGVVGLALVVVGIWYFLRRRKRGGGPGADNAGPVEMGGEPVVEMSAKEVPKPSELPEARAEAYAEPPPQELGTDGERGIGVAIGDRPEEKPGGVP